MTEDKIEAKTEKIEKVEEKVEKKSKKPSWVKTKPADFEKLVIELYKQGNDASKIGIILRDQHGVPKSKIFGKRIMEIIKEAKIPIRSEADIISKKIEVLKLHIEKNKHDVPAKKAFVKETWALKKAVDTNS